MHAPEEDAVGLSVVEQEQQAGMFALPYCKSGGGSGLRVVGGCLRSVVDALNLLSGRHAQGVVIMNLKVVKRWVGTVHVCQPGLALFLMQAGFVAETILG